MEIYSAGFLLWDQHDNSAIMYQDLPLIILAES
jgi:hypothetical protein